jgi:hypothetical protein
MFILTKPTVLINHYLAKPQVNGDNKTQTTVLISARHAENLTPEIITEIIEETVIKQVLAEYKELITEDTKFIVNTSLRFTISRVYQLVNISRHVKPKCFHKNITKKCDITLIIHRIFRLFHYYKRYKIVA